MAFYLLPDKEDQGLDPVVDSENIYGEDHAAGACNNKLFHPFVHHNLSPIFPCKQAAVTPAARLILTVP